MPIIASCHCWRGNLFNFAHHAGNGSRRFEPHDGKLSMMNPVGNLTREAIGVRSSLGRMFFPQDEAKRAMPQHEA